MTSLALIHPRVRPKGIHPPLLITLFLCSSPLLKDIPRSRPVPALTSPLSLLLTAAGTPLPVPVLAVAAAVAAALLDPHELHGLAHASCALELHEARACALGVAAALPPARGAPLQAVLPQADAILEFHVGLLPATGRRCARVPALKID